MDYALDRCAREAHELILATGRVPADLVELAEPKPNIPADLAFPTFRAAKALGVPPPQLAQELAAGVHIGVESLVGGVAAAGPFLNFTIDAGRLTEVVLDEIAALGDGYGRDDRGAGRTIVVDYSSPNIAKRMHVGHIRSTIIGQSIVNILRFQGYMVIGDNHLGDWGKQFGVVIASVMRYGKPEAEGEAALAQLEEMYTRYNTEMKEQPELDAAARAWSLRLEQGDPQARELWQWTVDLTLQINQQLYDRLGVRIDHAYGESFYEDKMAPVIEQAVVQGLAFRSKGKLAEAAGGSPGDDGAPPDEDGNDEGALAVSLPGLPSFLLQRSDGGTLYMTRDIATILFRVQAFQPASIIYVIGIPQELYLRQLFALVRAMGEAEGVELVHVKFGTVFDQQGQKLSTRRGNMVYLQALLDDAHARAREVIERADPDLSPAEKETIAEIVGVGAVIYNDLYQDPRRDITLDWDRMLALEGNSAPYIQYMYARCRSIIRKAEEEGVTTLGSHPALLIHPAEITLVKHLAKLPQAVREASERYAPFVVAEWCYTTARALSAFYRDCPVLRAETAELRAARLQLVSATAQALHNGLALLGIRAPERM